MPKELIRVRDRFYILSTSGRIDDRTRVLKQGDTFAVFDRFGDIDSLRQRELGIYHKDTRFLSRLALRLGNQRPSLLSSTIREDNALMAVDLTNFDVRQGDQVVIPRGTIHIFRSKILWEATCYDRLYIHNYGRLKVDLRIVVEFDDDVAVEKVTITLRSAKEDEPEVFTVNEQFNHCLNRSIAYLHVLRTETPYGPYPYAGVR